MKEGVGGGSRICLYGPSGVQQSLDVQGVGDRGGVMRVKHQIHQIIRFTRKNGKT